MDILSAAGEIEILALDHARLAERCASGEYSVVVSQLRDRFDADLLDTAKLTGISNYAVGFDNIDIAAATARGITVGNTPGVLTDSTADIAMLLMLSTARRAIEADSIVRSGGFTGWAPEFMLGTDVSGQVLGLAGFGRIARATARRALGFGMKIKFCPRPPSNREVSNDELGEFVGRVEHVSWDELVTTSDFLSLHVPLNDATHHLVDAEILNAMKDSAILINTARGPVVDEAALVAALQDRTITAAGLDVFECEPALAPGLAELPNAVLLPHVGSATVSVRSEMARLCAENAAAMVSGKLPPHPVNPSAWTQSG
ncbi:2-hydroxyacid dehydrogenase (plasmid) [Rhodococcoides fascians]|uniref:2-hydroxyacid dehydrogenase n=1 Tax=Rhodococcoides fascians TaxID=1828 RepID=UPI003899CEFD